MTSPGKLSLFITLGVAAIDMLSCAFISATVLFVMFLVPASSPGTAAAGTQNVLMVHWSSNAPPGATIGLEIGPKNNPTLIWSDSREADLAALCDRLSKLATQGACALLEAAPARKKEAALDGVLAIAEPISGEWDLTVIYADSSLKGNAGVPGDIKVTFTIVGSDALVVDLALAAGEEKSLVQSADANASILKKMLQIQ